MPPLKAPYQWQSGRPTRMQGTTSRPPSVWVEEWRDLSDGARLKAIADWEKEKAARDKVRASEGLSESIPPEDLPDYHAVIKEMLLTYKEKTSPAMACNAIGNAEVILSRATSLMSKFPGEYRLIQDILHAFDEGEMVAEDEAELRTLIMSAVMKKKVTDLDSHPHPSVREYVLQNLDGEVPCQLVLE